MFDNPRVAAALDAYLTTLPSETKLLPGMRVVWTRKQMDGYIHETYGKSCVLVDVHDTPIALDVPLAELVRYSEYEGVSEQPHPDPDDPDSPSYGYFPHAGDLSPEVTPDQEYPAEWEPLIEKQTQPDPEPDEPGPGMKATIYTDKPAWVSSLLFENNLKPDFHSDEWNDEADFICFYSTDSLYRDLDRFLDHCQAIRLIRDWQIER